MAEGILREKLDREEIANVTVSSAGIWATNGMPAVDNARLVARSHDVDLSWHHARKLNMNLIDEADLILVMEEAHVDSVRKNYPSAADRLFMIKAFGPKAGGGEVADPMGSGLEIFETCYDELDYEICRIFPAIQKRISKKRSVFPFLKRP